MVCLSSLSNTCLVSVFNVLTPLHHTQIHYTGFVIYAKRLIMTTLLLRLALAQQQRLQDNAQRARTLRSLPPNARLAAISPPDSAESAAIPIRSRHIRAALHAINLHVAQALAEVSDAPPAAVLPAGYYDRRFARRMLTRDLQRLLQTEHDRMPARLDPFQRAYKRALHYAILACRLEIERQPVGQQRTLSKVPYEHLMVPPVPAKRCPSCATVKDAQEFHRCRDRADGLQGYCKACLLARRRAQYQRQQAQRRQAA